jgi:hypothetical protein
MKKDKNKTQVVFLINETNNDLFAFFPKEEYLSHPSDLKTSYVHIGQHSACSIEYAKESRLATKEEYKDLKEELESIGYNLELTTLN